MNGIEKNNKDKIKYTTMWLPSDLKAELKSMKMKIKYKKEPDYGVIIRLIAAIKPDLKHTFNLKK